MENITLKEHRMENEFFEKKDFQFAAVVEFRIENFGISDLYEEDQKGTFLLTQNPIRVPVFF